MIRKKKSPLTDRFGILDIFLFSVLTIYSLILIALIFWAVLTSLKSADQYYYSKIAFPTKRFYGKYLIYNPKLETHPVWNFGTIFNYYSVKVSGEKGSGYVGFTTMVVYSLLYATGCAFVNTLTQCITAYACAKFPCKVSNILYGIVVVVMIIPIVGSLPAEIQLAKNLHIFDSIIGQWVMKANYLGIYFLVFFSTFKSLPKTYMEAAKIDGANNGYILRRIMLPLVRNEFFTILIINFIAYWNDYQIPLLYLPTKPTIAYGIYQLSTSYTEGFDNVPMRLAGAVAMLIPMLAIFVGFHKRLLGNLTVGGIKG